MAVIRRNDPCPCKSGKKYKNCCAQNTENMLPSAYSNSHDIKEVLSLQTQLISEAYNEDFKTTKPMVLKALELGKNVDINGQHKEYLSGVYVNCSTALNWLASCSQQQSEREKLLQDALDYSRKALAIKPTNNQAKLCGYFSALKLNDFSLALEYIKSINDKQVIYTRFPDLTQELRNSCLAADKCNMKSGSTESILQIIETLNLYVSNDSLGIIIDLLYFDYYAYLNKNLDIAYTYGTKAIEKIERHEVHNRDIGFSASFYSEFSVVCLALKKLTEGLQYAQKAYEIKNTLPAIKLNYLSALCENNRVQIGKELGRELVNELPCDASFYLYAKILFHANQLDEAQEWIKKALFISEDETNLKLMADICFEKRSYTDAITYYEKCIFAIDSDNWDIEFIDFDGKLHKSKAFDKAFDSTVVSELYENIIISYLSIGDFEHAYVYLCIAKNRYPDILSWRVFNKQIPVLSLAQSRVDELNQQMQMINEEYRQQSRIVREWALELIKLQDGTDEYKLDNEANWQQFENAIDNIINNMKRQSRQDTKLINQIEERINSEYPYLDSLAREFLCTAEALFELHKSSCIDFAAIAVQYCKVLEKQLRYIIGDLLPSKVKMLGEMIRVIAQNKISPYYRYQSQLERINRIRRNSAHTGKLTRDDVEEIRKVYFDMGLLSKLR